VRQEEPKAAAKARGKHRGRPILEVAIGTLSDTWTAFILEISSFFKLERLLAGSGEPALAC
jgi:hypothetical protein